MRVRAEWLICSAFLLSMAGCGSSKHSADTDAGDNDAATAAGAGKGSTSTPSTGGSSASAGSGKSTSAGTGGDDSTQAGNGGATEDDAGVSNTGSGGTSASAGTGGAGQSGGAAGSTATTLPSDGNQLALCTMAEGDCNKGFACYSPASAFSAGRGFCSKICTMQSDCDGLDPTSTKYACPTGAGTKVCEASCTGADDTSCPSGMTCQETAAAIGGMGKGMGGGGNGGSGGTPAVFHCKYPLETSPAWGECGDGTHTCDKDLTCQGQTLGRSGYCSQSCDMDSDCSKPSTGKATPTCVEIVPARGMTKAVKACGLSCADAKDGCPDGETCVDGPKDKDGKAAYSRCEF